MFQAIETERLRIRDVVLSDRDAFHAYMKRETYWRHVPIEPPTLEWVETLVKNCIREQDRDPRTHYFLAAVSKETGAVVGEAILRIENFRHGQAEIGWGVDSEHTGRGLGTEIGQAMLSLGFSLGLHRSLCPLPRPEHGVAAHHGQARHDRGRHLARKRQRARRVVVVGTMVGAAYGRQVARVRPRRPHLVQARHRRSRAHPLHADRRRNVGELQCVRNACAARELGCDRAGKTVAGAGRVDGLDLFVLR